MQVHYDEGVAIHIGPEPCVGVRKDGDEASVGEGIGQPLSRESQSRVPTLFRARKATRFGRTIARSERPGVVACAEAPWTGTGRSHVWPAAVRRSGPHREGEEP